MLKVSRRSVNDWVSRYLSEEQKQQLANFINERSQSDKGGRLTGIHIHAYIQQEFAVTYHPRAVYKLLHSLGFSWITSLSKHPKQSQQAQDEFKKLEIELIKNAPVYIPLANINIWFQDEARIGQQNTTTRLWAKKGSRPRAVKQQQFDYAYLFGAVCPKTGETEALISPCVNKEVQVYLAKTS